MYTYYYRFIYLSGLNTTQALDKIEQELPETEEIIQIVNFIRSSNRGIIRGNMEG